MVGLEWFSLVFVIEQADRAPLKPASTRRAHYGRQVLKLVTYRQFKIALAGIFLCLAAAACRHAAETRKIAPDAAVNGLIDALGGQRRLDRIRLLRFDITRRFDDGTAVRQSYWLDRQRGLCRIEGTRVKTGAHVSAVMNLKTKEGKALIGLRAKATNDPAIINELIGDAFNDADWLFGFTRWGEPGSRIRSAGVQNVSGQACPTIDLDLTGPPHRNYLMHLAANGKKMLAWTVAPIEKSRKPTTYLIAEWYEVRGFRLPVRFERLSGPGARVILIDKIFAPESIEEQIFFQP